MKKDNKFTHFDNDGKAIMVDISDKNVTERLASAISSISMNEQTLNMIKSGNAKKGDVLGIARIAGIMAAKKTSELIPLCHPISLSSVTIDFEIDDNTNSINIICNCKLNGKTGLEMEALTAVSIAALTIYDMCKAVDREMTITKTQLTYKSGGKSGTFKRDD
ncbi:MAG: cyclic pyranopterin monophosphate synthase MoaC [Alphaproteobacteria bacterium]|jgi:cyclic pyranopterin phosphate synthase|tara:strand:+ start:230 stop:718 length:489 start_codon:yes stop_codon:yes gene_type:complete